jgi:hypothetical protein
LALEFGKKSQAEFRQKSVAHASLWIGGDSINLFFPVQVSEIGAFFLLHFEALRRLAVII